MSGDENRVEKLKLEISKLRDELQQKEKELFDLQFPTTDRKSPYCPKLRSVDIIRYSRQMLMPQISLNGQYKLGQSKVLIVGVGGLGCPCAEYLAAAGVGQITLVDNDEVELTNLHRQILHSENDIGTSKVKSAQYKLQAINSSINIIPVQMHADSKTLGELFNKNSYDVVVDGSDNVATRYLLNDACVLHDVPLVSGSALQMEGQLTVYHYRNGPCYRCLFPVPPPPETVTSCGDGGVLGAVPGIIGVLQAMEVIKILTGQSGVLSGRLLTFDGCDTTFRNIKLRQRNLRCEICGDSPSIESLIDYEQFCGARAHDKVTDITILRHDECVTVQELMRKVNRLLIDVRPKLEYVMCNLPSSFNFPYGHIQKCIDIDVLKNKIEQHYNNGHNEVFVICRRGNDSQRAIVKLKELFAALSIKFLNVDGGLHSYSKMVDENFPVY